MDRKEIDKKKKKKAIEKSARVLPFLIKKRKSDSFKDNLAEVEKLV